MAESRQAPPTAPRALRAPTFNDDMPKGRRWRALQQTCNMTPCSLYCPNSHSSTSSISRSPPAEPNTNARPGRDGPVPRPIQRTRTRSLSGRLFRGRSRRPVRNLQPSGTSSAASRRPFRARGKAGEQPVELTIGQSRGITSWRRPAPSELMRTLIPHPTIPHGDGSSPYRIRETPPGHPQNNLSDVEKIILGRPRPSSGDRSPLPRTADSPAPSTRRPPIWYTCTQPPRRTPAPTRRPDRRRASRRRPRGRRPFRRPGKDR